MELRNIYELHIEKPVAMTKMAQWFNKIEKLKYDGLSALKQTFEVHSSQITNFFNSRLTNAEAESLNAKLKN